MTGMPALSLLRQRGIVSASLLLALCALAVALSVGFAYVLPMLLVVAGAFGCYSDMLLGEGSLLRDF
jgi:hypothetical protein